MSELTLFENEIEGSKIVNCQSYAGKNLVFVSNMEYKRTFKYLAHEMIEPQVYAWGSIILETKHRNPNS